MPRSKTEQLNKDIAGKLHGFPLVFKPPIIYTNYCIHPNTVDPNHPLVIEPKNLDLAKSYNPANNNELIKSFASLNNDDDILSFVETNGFLLKKDNATALEDYEYFKIEIKKAKQMLELYDAIIQPHDSLKSLKKRISVVKNKLLDDNLKAVLGIPKYIITLDGEELNLSPNIHKNMDKTGSVILSAGISDSPYDYYYSNVDQLNPTQWKSLALDIIGKTIYDKMQSIRLSFDHVHVKKDSNGDSLLGEDHLPQLAIKPCLHCPDLLALMYFQFYCRISSDQPIKPCKKCGELFKPETHKEKYCYHCRYSEDGRIKFPSQSLYNRHLRKKQRQVNNQWPEQNNTPAFASAAKTPLS